MERGPKNGFEAGQPIDTDDAMNDMPKDTTDKFVEGIQKKIADGVYTQEEGDALIAKAEARKAEKAEQAENEAAYNAWANMTPDEANARSDAFANDFAGEENLNSKTGKERTESNLDLYPRMPGESNEEYGARIRQINEMKKQFLEENPEPEDKPAEKTTFDTYKEMVEKRVESGDLKREDADAMLARRGEQIAEKAENAQKIEDYNEAQEKAKMEMAERIRKEVPEALEFLEKHPELKTEMVAAVKKLEELEQIANIKEGADKAVDAELVKRNETFMKAVEAFNAAARANEAARAKMQELEERSKKGGNVSDEEYAKVEEEIHESEKVMAEADADKKNAENEYNAAEAAIRGDAEKRTDELNARINERDKYVESEREYYNKNVNEALANGDAEKVAELKQDQVEAADVMEEWVDRGLGKKPAGEGDDAGEAGEAGEGGEDLPGGGFEAGEAGGEDAGERENAEFEAFAASYLSDPEWRAIYTKDGVFDEARCREALKDMWKAKKAEDAKAAEAAPVKKIDTDGAGEDLPGGGFEAGEAGEDEDDGFENENQRGLFAKIKNFFNRNKRVKDGGKNALKKKGGWRKIAKAALLAFLVGNQIANFMPQDMAKNIVDTAGNGVAIEDVKEDGEDEDENKKVDLEDVADNLSLEADLNAEKGEELSDLIDTKYSDGTDLEINLSYGDYEGSAFFAEGKEGIHNFTPWLYDHETEGITDAQKAEQIQENIDQLADDPVLQGQMAALMGADLTIDGKSVTSFDAMRDVQELGQSDSVFQMNMANAIKDINRELAGHTLNLETVKQGDVYSSLYVVNVADEGEQPRMVYFKDDQVTARVDFEVLQYLDEDNQNILDTNEIGGRKYNFLKAVGVIPEDATDEEAQDIMSKIRILGISGKCGQLIWQHITPDTGSEGTGSEGTGEEGTGDEGTGEEGTGS